MIAEFGGIPPMRRKDFARMGHPGFSNFGSLSVVASQVRKSGPGAPSVVSYTKDRSGEDFASYHYLLRLIVEGDFLAGLDGGDVHA
jgi:hypothetical protein